MPDGRRCDKLQKPSPASQPVRALDVEDDSTKQIALTFDDGPSMASTDNSSQAVLDVLAKYGIKATFFVVGQQVDGNPSMVVNEFEAGHLVENHSVTHPEFSTLTEQQMIDEIDTVNKRLDEIGVPVPKYFRPPYGDGDGGTLTALLSDRGLTPVYWDIDSRDWELPDVEQVHQGVLHDLQAAWDSGKLTNIVLFHDIQPHTHAIVDLLIPELQAAGCQFVMIDAVV